MRCLIGLIHLSNKIRNFFANNDKFKKFNATLTKIAGVIFVFTFFFGLPVLFVSEVKLPTLVEYLMILLLATYPISKTIGEIGSTLITVKGFMFNGLIFTIVVFVFTLEFDVKIINRDILENFSSDFSIVNSMVIPVLASTVVWSILSCLAETKIAIVGNAVLTGIITLLREILLYVFSFYEQSPETPNHIIEILSPVELNLYSVQQQLLVSDAINKAINTIALPFIITLGVATIVSLLKDYIEEKEIKEKRSEKKVITSPSGELQCGLGADEQIRLLHIATALLPEDEGSVESTFGLTVLRIKNSDDENNV